MAGAAIRAAASPARAEAYAGVLSFDLGARLILGCGWYGALLI